MEYTQVDVFAEAPYSGNPLAVFPDAGDLDPRQMQAIASELNLSETSFVISAQRERYEMRIFTPTNELPFAGHPTLGTAWTLRDKGIVTGDVLVQRTAAGETTISTDGDVLWLERSGTSEGDLEDVDRTATSDIAKGLGIDERGIGLEARELGRAGRLRPAFADGGLRQLIVPVADVDTLRRCVPPVTMRTDDLGAYCFTAAGAGQIKARGLWPKIGIPEDPATGSGAVNLGLYLADRIGDIDAEITQGEQIGRPSRMLLRARKGNVRLGGRCVRVAESRLVSLP
ncbi:MAG: PhzF family phenazine biosynthesis protein [Actinomycetota bacterium]|nr:PhzF family phenazine biosynthesis protein [Actinomycetota bacterium]